jgi:UDP-2,4-diacetamido-2,4,6-trideoxy-beta-L-altropyranose hydrolase
MRLLIRADASTSIGTGHVLRCLALAQAAIDAGDEVRFLCCEIPDSLAERVRREGIEIITSFAERGNAKDLDALLLVAQGWANVVVLDGYAFDQAFQGSVMGAGFRTMVLDDDRPGPDYAADILLNQNHHAKSEAYEGAQLGKMLLGPKFALLRREFRDQPAREASYKTRHVLVTLGGSDPDNVAKKVIESLQFIGLKGIQARVLVGSSNPHEASLREAVETSGVQVELLSGVDDMRAQYEWADLAVSAGGSTAWELAFMGVPSVVIILVDNQESIAKSVWRAGIGRLVGWHQQVTPEQIAKEVRELLVSTSERDKMGRWGQELVDGQGAMRVLSVLRELMQ